MFDKIIRYKEYIIIKVFIGLLCTPLLEKTIRLFFLSGTLLGTIIRYVLNIPLV